jgi:hypothetical protein
MSSDKVLASTCDWFLYSFRRPSVGADTVCLVWSSTPITTTKILLAFKIKNRRPITNFRNPCCADFSCSLSAGVCLLCSGHIVVPYFCLGLG